MLVENTGNHNNEFNLNWTKNSIDTDCPSIQYFDLQSLI